MRSSYKPEKAAFAADTPRLIEAFHSHVIEVAGPVHGRAGVGLGEHQQFGGAAKRLSRGRQRGKARRGLALARFAQNAKT
jgi:hypothetical protein